MAQPGKLTRRGRPREAEARPVRPRRYPYLFLIVCEDQRTEPYYFEHIVADIPANTVYLRSIGTGRDPLGVVQQALLARAALQAEANKDVDEVWVVFDKDDADLEPSKTERFATAWETAFKSGLHLAFSNEVFELWLLLYLTDVDAATPLPRLTVYARLETALQAYPTFRNFVYQHGKPAVVDAVLTVGSEAQAVSRAAALLTQHIPKPPLATNPSTRMHLLVRRLRDLIEFYTPYQP